MAENTFPTSANTLNGACENSSGSFKEAVCIDTSRVYDSCADKDCLQDLRVYFTEAGQHVIDQACTVRIKTVDVLTVYVDLDSVPFNKGFYSVDMTFFFEINLDVFLSPAACPVNVTGLAVSSKKVILFGSEGKVKIFNSGACYDDLDLNSSPLKNLPKATVQVAEPIGLSARICCDHHDSCELGCHIPECVCKKFGGEFQLTNNTNAVYVTIGIFTIVQLERSVQMLVPSYDFCVPEKECVTTSDNPCELFNRLEFPTEEFFPPRSTDNNSDPSGNCGCGCNSFNN